VIRVLVGSQIGASSLAGNVFADGLEAAGFQIRLGKRMSAINVLSDISLKFSHASRPFSFLDELKESIAGRLVGDPPHHAYKSLY